MTLLRADATAIPLANESGHASKTIERTNRDRQQTLL